MGYFGFWLALYDFPLGGLAAAIASRNIFYFALCIGGVIAFDYFLTHPGKAKVAEVVVEHVEANRVVRKNGSKSVSSVDSAKASNTIDLPAGSKICWNGTVIGLGEACTVVLPEKPVVDPVVVDAVAESKTNLKRVLSKHRPARINVEPKEELFRAC
jgi:hypothetical protein